MPGDPSYQSLTAGPAAGAGQDRVCRPAVASRPIHKSGAAEMAAVPLPPSRHSATVRAYGGPGCERTYRSEQSANPRRQRAVRMACPVPGWSGPLGAGRAARGAGEAGVLARWPISKAQSRVRCHKKLGERAAHAHLATDHLAPLDVKRSKVLIQELQCQLVRLLSGRAVAK